MTLHVADGNVAAAALYRRAGYRLYRLPGRRALSRRRRCWNSVVNPQVRARPPGAAGAPQPLVCGSKGLSPILLPPHM